MYLSFKIKEKIKMGMLKITTAGSFGVSERTFSAMDYGHAHAISEAIGHLNQMLKKSINQDHELHGQGHKPNCGFINVSD